MGLFGWHKCREEGCDATLFIPLFEEYLPGSTRWQEYLDEKARWHTTADGYGERCPAHKPSSETPPAPP